MILRSPSPSHLTDDDIVADPRSSISEEPADQEYQEEGHQQERVPSDPMKFFWYNHLLLCILGIAAGMLITGISRFALQTLLVIKNDQQYCRDHDTFGDKVKLVILTFLSNLGDLFYVLFCILFAWILGSGPRRTSAGAQGRCLFPTQRTTTQNSNISIDDSDDGEDDGSEDILYLSTRDTFIAIVYLKAGYHLGASLADFALGILLKSPRPPLS